MYLGILYIYFIYIVCLTGCDVCLPGGDCTTAEDGYYVDIDDVAKCI